MGSREKYKPYPKKNISEIPHPGKSSMFQHGGMVTRGVGKDVETQCRLVQKVG